MSTVRKLGSKQSEAWARLLDDVVDGDVDWGKVSKEATALLGMPTVLGPENVGTMELSSGGYTVVHLGADKSRQPGSGDVLLLPHGDDNCRLGPWEDVFDDPTLLVEPNSEFEGELWDVCFEEGNPPLHFDAAAWAGTYESDGDESWELRVNGETVGVQLEEIDRWGSEPPKIPAQTWASFDGEFGGASLYSDHNGCLWGYVSERATMFFGRPDSMDGKVSSYLGDLLYTSARDAEYELLFVAAPTLEPAAALDLAQWLGSLDPNFDASECVVTCDGFDGTVDELVALCAGESPDGDEDDEDDGDAQ